VSLGTPALLDGCCLDLGQWTEAEVAEYKDGIFPLSLPRARERQAEVNQSQVIKRQKPEWRFRQKAAVMLRVGAACFVLTVGAGAAQAEAVADCNQGRDPQLRLRACSEIISGAGYGADQKAIAYRKVAGYAGRAPARLALRDFDGRRL
jgi:hypothetical protein